MHLTKPILAATALLLVASGASGCALDPSDEASPGASSSKAGGDDLTALPSITADQDLAASVPADVRSRGLTVATSSNLPPMTYEDEKNDLVGFDVDMARAIGRVLDLDTKVTTAGFDTIIPGLAAERYSMALSSLGVTAERLQTVDFVSYYRGGQGFLAASSSKFKIKDLTGLCGRRVAVGAGSVQEATLQEDEKTLCTDSGLDPWRVQVFPDSNAAVLGIRSDRVDVLYASISIVSYTADQNDDFRVAGRYQRSTVGAALPKGSPLTPVVQKAVQELIDDGAYDELLSKWGLDDNAIKTAEINTVPSQ